MVKIMVKLIVSTDHYGERHYEFEVDGEVVSECCVVHADNYICNLCTYPQFQNRGYARKMLQTIFTMFADQRMWLRAYVNNAPAIKAYTAVGFTTFRVDDYESHFYEEPCKVANMEIHTPAKSEMKTRVVYGLSYDETELSFDSEADRNEMALALWQEHSYFLWARTLNWYDCEDAAWEAEKAEEDANENVMTFEVIHVEE